MIIIAVMITCGAGMISTPPDGEMIVTSDVGMLKGWYRIYADKDWLDDWNEPAVGFIVVIDSQYGTPLGVSPRN